MVTDKEFDEEYMKMAAEISAANIDNGGGPFGAVIVKDGEVISTGSNRVTLSNDPTAHAEVEAIRQACRRLNTFRLEGCVVYSSCEPCPMCLSALYWAGVKKIFYGNTKEDAASIGFSDKFIYEEIDRRGEDRYIPTVHVGSHLALSAFKKWVDKPDKVEY